MELTPFERFAGISALLAGVSTLLYSVAFVIIARSDAALGGRLSAVFLMLIGLFASFALVALYARLRETDAAFALWALLVGFGGAMGSVIHGAHDLAVTINPPAGR